MPGGLHAFLVYPTLQLEWRLEGMEIGEELIREKQWCSQDFFCLMV